MRARTARPPSQSHTVDGRRESLERGLGESQGRSFFSLSLSYSLNMEERESYTKNNQATWTFKEEDRKPTQR